MKIMFTGGGTAGHITPNIALINELRKMELDMFYIGTKEGMEYDLITKENIKFLPIKAGKLRRYFDLKTITDSFKVIIGFFQAMKIIMKIKPDVVFSKGGFVSCPVIWASWVFRIPIIIHESDYSPGLANKLSMPFAKEICITFPETKDYIKATKKLVLTGLPVRRSILTGDRKKGLQMCNFNDKKPIILVIGGSQGAATINNVIWSNLDELLKTYQICHICGNKSISNEYMDKEGYIQFGYVKDELADLFKISDIVVSRSGATSIFEILELKKPNLLIPLSKKASRGDQILNAESFKKRGLSKIIFEENLTKENFISALDDLYKNKEKYIANMKEANSQNALNEVIKVIKRNLGTPSNS